MTLTAREIARITAATDGVFAAEDAHHDDCTVPESEAMCPAQRREDDAWQAFTDEVTPDEVRAILVDLARLREFNQELANELDFFVQNRDETVDWEDGGPGEIAHAKELIARARSDVAQTVLGEATP